MMPTGHTVKGAVDKKLVRLVVAPLVDMGGDLRSFEERVTGVSQGLDLRRRHKAAQQDTPISLHAENGPGFDICPVICSKVEIVVRKIESAFL